MAERARPRWGPLGYLAGDGGVGPKGYGHLVSAKRAPAALDIKNVRGFAQALQSTASTSTRAHWVDRRPIETLAAFTDPIHTGAMCVTAPGI